MLLRTVLAASALGLSALPAIAGNYGCVGNCYRQEAVPPSYGTVTERYMVRAPRTYAITTPAQYSTVYDRVMVSPGGKSWSVTRDAYGRAVGCWVTTPPRFATVPRTVMTQAPQVVPYAEPAQYGVRSHTVQTSPGYRAWVPLGGASYGAPSGISPVGYGPAPIAPPAYGPGYNDEGPGFGVGPGRGYGRGPAYGRSPGYGRNPGYGRGPAAYGPGSVRPAAYGPAPVGRPAGHGPRPPRDRAF